jgi:shikimate kinase
MIDVRHAVLEDRYGKSIREIFAEEGEAGFREKEAAILEELTGFDGCVIATGGGVVIRDDNRERLKLGPVVWLQAPAEVLWQRLQGDPSSAEQRPDLGQGGLTEIEEILRARNALYEACHDRAVDTSQQAPEQIKLQGNRLFFDSCSKEVCEDSLLLLSATLYHNGRWGQRTMNNLLALNDMECLEAGTSEP